MNLEALAHEALTALLAQKNVYVTHPKGWQRDGFPLPWKRMQPKADGSVTQPYRPLAILEYVHEKLSRPSEPAGAEPKAADGEDLFGGEPAAESEDLFGGGEPNLFG